MEWKEVRLEEIGQIVGGATPSTKIPEYYDGDIPWLSPKDLSSNRDIYVKRGERNITEIGFKSCSCKILPKGSVLFSSRAPIGYVAIAANDLCTNQGFKSIIPNSQTNSEFLYYLLIFNKDRIAQQGSGTTFMEVSGKTMSQISVKIPTEIDDQRRIASILSSLDRKIELNNKINAQLEEMAQAIFKHWFIDFGPFKDGKFVESELGMIPEGWRVGTLGEIAEITKKSINPAKNPDTLFAHYSLPAFDDYRLPVFQQGNEIMSNKTKFESKTTLISKLNPHIKRIWYINEVDTNSICSTEFIPIKGRNDNYAAFIYFLLNCDKFYNLLTSSVNGATTSHQRIHPDDILKLQLPIREKAIILFEQKISPILKKQQMNLIENQKLSSLRDTLLPKLMSGELEI